MATITSFIQLDSSGVELGGLAININGSAPYPAQHKLFIPFIRASELEMRAVLQSGNSASLVNNISNWTSCDALSWPILRATATRNDAVAGTTTNTHIVNIQIRRKDWHQDTVSGNITLVNNAVVTVSPLANQPWNNFTVSQYMADTGTGYIAYVRLTFLNTGTLQVRRHAAHGGTVDIDETENYTWNAGISVSDLELRVVLNQQPDGVFTNTLESWTAGSTGGNCELRIMTTWNEPEAATANFNVEVRQISNPANLGVTVVQLEAALTY